MARIRRTFYGWMVRPGAYAVASQPPDPVPLNVPTFASIAKAEYAASQKRAVIIWSGPALIERQIHAALIEKQIQDRLAS